MLRFVAVVLALNACATGPSRYGDTPAPADLADRFELIAFYEEPTGRELLLHRWHGEIRVGLATANTARYSDDIRRTIDALNSLLPQPTQLVAISDHVTSREWLWDSNVDILIDTQDQIRAHLEYLGAPPHIADRLAPLHCFVVMFSNDPGEPERLTGAVVMIHRDIGEDQIRRCITQELTQAMGLPNDIADPEGTVFASGTLRKTLSEGDKDLVRILYDPRLKTGMTRAEAMPIVRNIVAEIEAERAAR